MVQRSIIKQSTAAMEDYYIQSDPSSEEEEESDDGGKSGDNDDSVVDIINAKRTFSCDICSVEIKDLAKTEEEYLDLFKKSEGGGTCHICFRSFTELSSFRRHRALHFDNFYDENRFACLDCTENVKIFHKQTGKGGPFECGICRRSYSTQKLLGDHIRDHKDRVVYECKECSLKCIGEARMYGHSRCHEGVKIILKCLKCLRTFKGRTRLAHHVLSGRCKRKSSSTTTLLPKKIEINVTKKFNCKMCGEQIKDFIKLNENLQKNITMPMVKGIFYCAICHFKFFNSFDLKQHQLKHFDNNNPEEFACLSCNENHKNYIINTECIDKPDPALYCHHCNKNFPKIVDFDIHQRDHMDRVVYECDVCNKTYIGQRRFKKHKISHNKDKADEEIEIEDDNCFKCTNGCGRTFSRQISLNRHIMICKKSISTVKNENDSAVDEEGNAGKIKYLCPFCNELFKDSKKWRAHCKIHLMIYCCAVCPMEFPNKNKLNQHRLVHLHNKSTTVCDEQIVDGMENNVTDDDMKIYAEDLNVDFVDNYFDDDDHKELNDESDNKDSDDDHLLKCTIKSELNHEAPNSEFLSPIVMLDEKAGLTATTVKLELEQYVQDDDEDDDDKPLQDLVAKNLIKKEKLSSANKSSDLAKSKKCYMCSSIMDDLEFSTEDTLQHIEKYDYCFCNICYKTFRYAFDLKVHKKDHFGKNVACRVCFEKTYPQIPFTVEDYHNLESTMKCALCTRNFKTIDELRKHKAVHYDRCVYNCDLCGEYVIGKEKYRRHLSNHRRKEKYSSNTDSPTKETLQLICELCGRQYSSKSSILSHFKTHLIVEKHECPLCPIKLKTKGGLHQHLKLHTGIKDFACEICGKMFFRKTNLFKHKVSHTGEKLYSCNLCDKSFRYCSGLKLHMRLHTGEKPFKCDKCDKRYKDSSDLRRHKRVHGGIEKKHKCDLCDMKFYENKYLRAHRFSAHNMAVV